MRISHAVVSILFAATVLTTAIVAAEDDQPSGIDLFLGACHHLVDASQSIKTGYAEFERIETKPVKNEEELQAEIKQRTESMRRRLADAENDTQRESYQKTIERIEKAIRAQNTAGERRSRQRIHFAVHESGTKRRVERSNFDMVNRQWSPTWTRVTDREHLPRGTCDTISSLRPSTATVSNLRITYEDFQYFGRIPKSSLDAVLLTNGLGVGFDFSADSAVRRFKEAIKEREVSSGNELYHLSGKADYDDGETAFIIENRLIEEGEKPFVAWRAWIDPSRGYVCPLIQVFSKQVTLAVEYKASDYFLLEDSRLWFPASYSERMFDRVSGKLKEKSEFHFDKDSLILNQNVTDDEFAIHLPAGASVLDSRGKKQLSYRALEKVSLSLTESGLNLAANPKLEAKP